MHQLRCWAAEASTRGCATVCDPAALRGTQPRHCTPGLPATAVRERHRQHPKRPLVTCRPWFSRLGAHVRLEFRAGACTRLQGPRSDGQRGTRLAALQITVCRLQFAGRRPRSKLKFTEKKRGGLQITVCSLPVAGRRPRSKLHFHRYICIFCALHAHASLTAGCKSTVQGASRSTTNPLNSHLPLAGFRVAAKGCLY